MPETEKARKPRATAEEKARAKRIERLVMRLWIAADQVGQVWRDADYPLDLGPLRTCERELIAEMERLHQFLAR